MVIRKRADLLRVADEGKASRNEKGSSGLSGDSAMPFIDYITVDKTAGLFLATIFSKNIAMKSRLFFLLILSPGFLLISCSSNTGNQGRAISSTDSIQPALLDTAKLRSDLNSIMSGVVSGKPDTAKLKAAGSDILSTTAGLLSDSGISGLGGKSQDPGVRKAREIFIRMRDSMGINPAALDSIRNAAKRLSPSRP